MRNVSGKVCGENQNTHFLSSKFFFFSPENRAFYELTWQNVVGGRQHVNMAQALCMLGT